MMSLIEREHEALFQTYKRLPLAIDRAEGCYIYDTNGNHYLDFLGGIAVNALGHSHPRILQAIHEQAEKYLHVSNYFYQEPQIYLAELLKECSGYDKVFFSNSGGEALDGAMKLARRWGHTQYKTEIISFTGGFHGRTYAALSLMAKPQYKQDMGPFLSGVNILPYNDSDALRSIVDKSTCAIILEFLQGEGGIVPANPEFIATIQALQQQYDFLIIADEIQTGLGRTGTFFSFESFSIQPDIVITAKGLGGGLPLGAILGNERVVHLWESGMHGTTFGGNALACAAGSVVLEELRGDLQGHVVNMGKYLHQGLLSLQYEFPSLIEEVRGRGLMAGLKLAIASAPFLPLMLEQHVIINSTAENVIRLVPPFIVQPEHIEELLLALRTCFTNYTG